MQMNKSKILGMIILTAAMLAANQFFHNFILNVLSSITIVITVATILRDLVVKRNS
jgi:hypothetical protein